MQKTHCRDCQGTELYDTVLSARNGVIIGRKTRTGDEWILVRCLVCLTCGCTMPYLSDDGLERLRHWAYQDGEPAAPFSAPEDPAAAGGRSPAPTSASAPSAETPGADPNPAPSQEKPAGFGTIVIFCLVVGTILGLLVVVYNLMHE